MYLFKGRSLYPCGDASWEALSSKTLARPCSSEYRSILLGFILIFVTIFGRVHSGEDKSLNIDELNKNVYFTEEFFLKHIPGALARDEGGEREGLNEVEEKDVSLIPTDDEFAPDLESITMTRASAEKERAGSSDSGRGAFPALDEELSLMDQDSDEDKSEVGTAMQDDSDPGSEEQKRILKYDTEKKKKLLKLRQRRKYKDIAFGPQAPHLAMVDIFGVTGDDTDNPLMEMYGLESRYGREKDLKDFEDLHSSVVNPTKFTEKKVWGYDREGNPIFSKKLWLEQKTAGKEVPWPTGAQNMKMEYSFSQKVYSTDGFLDEFGTFGVKSLLDKFRYKQENKFIEKKKKKQSNKLKEPEIVMELDSESGKLSGQDKHIGWQVTRRAMDVDARNKIINDFEGVEDLSGIIRAMNADGPDKQRKDAERVFWDYYSKKKQNKCEKKGNLCEIEVKIPDVSFSFDFLSKKTLFGWREVLFDQAMESIGKYDPRASKRYDGLLGSDQIKGIPPSRIIADMSSEAIRRPKSHHIFRNPIKGFKNLFGKRLERKYKEYVADVLQLRAEDKAYNELMDLANRYEARQDWLSQFENSWLFIPQGQAIPDTTQTEVRDGTSAKTDDDYEKELLSLELDAIPASDMEIFMNQHLKGDILFPDDDEAEGAKEAMFRKIIRETAEYNEKQPYRLPHRPSASKILPVNDGYNPTEALRQKERLTTRTKVFKQGRVVAEPIEKRKIKTLELGEKKKIEAANDKEEYRKSVKSDIIHGSMFDITGQEKGEFGASDKKTFKGNSDKDTGFDGEYIYKDEGRGARPSKYPSSTTAVSSSRAPFKRNPLQKTVFDNYLDADDT
ncbi:hypothetical protein OJ252_1481 [Cryptosporidium canis]|uniref:Uncharacterized protein n=1 Tax=Cryptosporidium canis TaxID=195482 RepID=A0ABQ8P802_9CRYT|nr:hypothetical protein OJ252_1481 [Cryptosporidium canis]